MPFLKKLSEYRILAWLGIIALSWHLLTTLGGALSVFADVFLLLVLSWVLAFILEPLVGKFSRLFPRVWAAVVVYLIMAAAGVLLVWVVLPTTVEQVGQLAALVPLYLPANSVPAEKIESFLAVTAANSLFLASSLASAAAGLFLVLILSFYFLISRKEISKFILDVIPDRYKEDYLFIEKVLNRTFASFLQVQVALGLVIGAVTFLTLLILGINFALSTGIFAAVLATVPVLGPLIFIIPVVLAGLTASVQKMLIAVTVVLLAAQLVYNLLAPKLLGSALKIHPIIVLLSFVFGYRLAGVWGAVFAVPIVSAGAIVGKELLKYWKKEAS